MTPPDAPTTDGFVGRVGELDQLGLALASARAGHGRAVLVIGDAGVGKTRLAQQAAIVASDFLVLTGACLPLSSLSVPLLPLRTALSAVTGERTLPVLRGASSSVAEEFDRWLEERCREQPVLLLVDDLQWADPATLDVLMWVVAGLAHRGLAVVATVRRGDVGPGHPMMRWLADVRRLPGFDEITLGLLDLEETRQQVGTLVGGVPHDTLVREVFERTGGNAYLNRLLVAGVPANATRLGDHALPEDLSTAVLRRWNDLSRDARELTLVAAVGARALRGDALDQAAAVAGVGDPAPLLRECVAAEVLDPQPLDGYWFHHPLQAEALESSLPEPERRRLHAAFAALLEAASAQTGPELSTAILVADHHYRAGDPEAAFTWAISAADHAEAAGADAEAVRLLHRAIGVHHFLAHPGVAVMDLRLRLREAAVRSGELEEELAVVEALLDDAERLGALLTSELVVRRQHLRFVTGAGFLELAEMERAVDLASGAPTSWQYAYALAECAHAALWADDPRAPDLADRALVQARAGHHPRALSHAFAASAMAADFDGRNDEALLLARQGVRAASMARDAFAFVHASLWEANAQASPADERYFETLHSRRVQLTSLGAPHPFLAWLAVVEAQSRLTCGHWEACRQLLREALGSTPGALVDVLGRLNAAELAARQGRPEEAKGHLARADELFAETSTFLAFQFDACRALVRLSAGDPRGCVTAALTGTETPGVPPTKCEWLLPLAARGLAELAQNSRDAGGDVQALIDEADDLERRFPHVIRDSGSTSEYDAILEGLDALYQAELARVRDAERLGPAWRWVAERLHGRLPWEECYAWWRAAESFLKEGPPQRARAVDALRDAHALAQRLVATPDLEQVEAIARGARVSLQVPVTQPFVEKSTTPRSTVALTARESEVLAHVVAGRTYGEIARALVLSEKTVSSHISHLLTKTGTRNRVDLARWAARRQASEEEARGPAS